MILLAIRLFFPAASLWLPDLSTIRTRLSSVPMPPRATSLATTRSSSAPLQGLFGPGQQLFVAGIGLGLEAHDLEIRISLSHRLDDLLGGLELQHQILAGLDLLRIGIQGVVGDGRGADQGIAALRQLARTASSISAALSA